MDEVIILSSDESDVEVVCSHPWRPPLSAFRADQNALNVSQPNGTSAERTTHLSARDQLQPEIPDSKPIPLFCKLFPDSPNSPELYNSESKPDLSNLCVKSEYEQTASNSPATDGTPEWHMDCEIYSVESVSPVSFVEPWDNNEVDMNGESGLNRDSSMNSRENQRFVSAGALKKIMGGVSQFLVDDDDVSFGPPDELSREHLSLVYVTIEENYTEGTLQLLSDLIQPWSYPPKDIISHLLRNILLNPQCPRDFSTLAFNLLMKAQRHHMADKNTVAWDWDLLTSVMDEQDSTKSHGSVVVRMLLEYVVQTIEDDFQANVCTSTLHQSIAKATLSCEQQFPRVRDIVTWLFTAITKTTECQRSMETTKERDEHLRKVSLFQRMLSMALEVDGALVLNCLKLSQELCQTLLSKKHLRAHRMLLLESIQSKLLQCKMLEALLNDASPPISVPMSLSLLLLYLKNCTLQQDPTDGEEKWKKWEELIQLIWMLLHSYDQAMKTCLSRSHARPQSSRTPTLYYKPPDKISKPAVDEAVESFRSRSQEDLGGSLPLHVEELLGYLQDQLLDVCQC